MAYKLKKVYICDHCSKVELPDMDLLGHEVIKVMPIGWTKLGKEHLCPECSRVYKEFINATSKQVLFDEFFDPYLFVNGIIKF